MKEKYWELLIQKSKRKLTLPYLIGSKKILFPNKVLDRVEDLLDEIICSDNNELYQMFHCPDIGEYVIFRSIYNDYLIKGLKVYHPITGKLKMVLGINMEVLGKDFDQIKSKLAERYAHDIKNHNFSYIERRWQPYSKKDIEEISSLINS